jgi:hypothetical protein
VRKRACLYDFGGNGKSRYKAVYGLKTGIYWKAYPKAILYSDIKKKIKRYKIIIKKFIIFIKKCLTIVI